MTSSLRSYQRSLVSLADFNDDQFDKHNIHSGSRGAPTDVCQLIEFHLFLLYTDNDYNQCLPGLGPCSTCNVPKHGTGLVTTFTNPCLCLSKKNESCSQKVLHSLKQQQCITPWLAFKPLNLSWIQPLIYNDSRQWSRDHNKTEWVVKTHWPITACKLLVYVHHRHLLLL